MAQKVATARKMKSQQENLPRPNCDSDGKANNKRQAFISTDTRSFKIQTGDLAGPLLWLKQPILGAGYPVIPPRCIL